MSYSNKIIDYLYFNKNLDDEDIIEIANDIIKECEQHKENNKVLNEISK